MPQALSSLCAATDSDTVLFNRRYEPAMRATDDCVEAALQAKGIRYVFCGKYRVVGVQGFDV